MMKIKIVRWLLLLSLLLIALVRYFYWWPEKLPGNLVFYNDQNKITFQGRVAAGSEKAADKQKLVVAGKDFNGRVLVSTGLYPEYNYGDLLEISCQLKTPQPVDDFDYGKYLARFKIFSLCYQPGIKLLAQNQGSWFYAEILKVRDGFGAVMDKSLSAPQSTLLKAIIFGQRGEMSDELLQQFSRTGVSHVIAVSGSHVTIIAAILFNLFLSLGIRRKVSFYLIIGSLIIFLLLIAWPASAVRAVVMGSLGLWAMQAGRLNNSRWSLIFTAVIMLAINPLLLFYDVGFQLSFLAVWGMMEFTDKFEALWQRLPFELTNILGFRDSLSMTMAAQVTTLPLIVYQFGQASLVSPVANMLVLPAVTPIMILGFIFAFVGLFSLSLAKILFWAEWLLLTYFLKVIEILNNWQWAAIGGLKVGWWFLIICYLALVVWIYKDKLRRLIYESKT